VENENGNRKTRNEQVGSGVSKETVEDTKRLQRGKNIQMVFGSHHSGAKIEYETGKKTRAGRQNGGEKG